jgi:hypothetical protein
VEPISITRGVSGSFLDVNKVIGTDYPLSIDIFRFTLYWTLCFYTPLFVLCGSYAFWNFNFPPRPRKTYNESTYGRITPTTPTTPVPLSHLHPLRIPSSPSTTTPLRRPVKPPKEKERRSRLAFALLVFLTFVTVGVAGAVVGSAVLGFSAYGLYKSGDFVMST